MLALAQENHTYKALIGLVISPTGEISISTKPDLFKSLKKTSDVHQ